MIKKIEYIGILRKSEKAINEKLLGETCYKSELVEGVKTYFYKLENLN